MGQNKKDTIGLENNTIKSIVQWRLSNDTRPCRVFRAFVHNAVINVLNSI